jgi:hypothetical protein
MKDQEFYKWYKRMIEHNPEDPPGSVWEQIQHGLDQDLYNWYKEGIENQNEIPPEQTWENIENRLDQNLFSWYGQGITNNAEDPPEAVWENIQDDLDIEDSWNKISEKLDHDKKKRINPLFYAAAAVLLIFIVLQVFSPFENRTPFSETQKEYVSEQDNAEAAVPEEGRTPVADTTSESRERIASGNVEPKPEKPKTEATAFDFEEKKSSSDKPIQERNLLARSEQFNFSKANPVNIEFKVSTDADLRNIPQHSQGFSATEEEESSSSRKPDYYVGMTGEMGQSWLLSQKTLYSIRKSPYSSASPNRGRSFGIVGGIRINDRLSLQMEGLIQDESGQSYREYADGEVVNNEIHLDYTSLDILGRYEVFKRSFSLPLSHHVVMGFYGSYLKDARQVLNGSSKNLRPAYKNYDIGMILGYEFDTQITPNFIISTGFRFDPGFINIYDGVPGLPADFNKTYSSSINLNVSFKYNLTD